ncbi:phosphatase PAP2 family protein [Xylophilus sp. ASV27]|uniref:phosphatase PAP2 family protein n=1 Tax=Xylophilus sp. ASV27 TaxID=2795129 RepID=UPI0018EB799D|nr:phosphatase PAP2 family protein [Xylophilus sp. ASV27]
MPRPALTTITTPLPAGRASAARLLGVTAASLAALLLWDASGLDLPLARWFGSAQGFALRDAWLFEQGLHRGARMLSWLLLAVLAAAVWRPVGVLRRIDRPARLQLVATSLLALLAVALLKSTSHTSCPWDLSMFGGSAPYVSHWAFGVADGGGGRCFPAGHASAGFAFIGGWFVLRRAQPRAAFRWLMASLAAGLLLGLSQQARGAHFMSHTLWTGWICWTTAWLCDAMATLLRARFGTRREPHAIA